jgi:hypothetical protein
VLGRAWCVAAERNGPNVCAHERIPFGALAETDLPSTKRCPRVIANGFAPLALTVFFLPHERMLHRWGNYNFDSATAFP